jgi:dolichol-phosphate mannosyltransferase
VCSCNAGNNWRLTAAKHGKDKQAIVRGYSFTVIPITWRNRRTGLAKLKIKEMGSRYLFIVLYVWLEKYFSRGDYKRSAA